MQPHRKLKVLALVDAFPRLSETFIQDQVNYLDADVLCLASDLTSSLTSSSRVHVLPVESTWYRLADRSIARLGHQLNQARAYRPLGPRRTRSARALVAKLKPEVLLGQFGPSVLRLLALDTGVPLVAHFHGADLSAYLRHTHYVRALRKAAHRIAGAVVVNEQMRTRLLQLGFRADQIALIPYGVRSAESLTSTAIEGSGQKLRVLSVGRLVAKKDILTCIRAFAQAHAQVPRLHYEVIGDGPLRVEAQHLIHTLGLEGSIELRGALPHGEVLLAMQRASLFLHHAVTAPDGDEEGWPIVVAEAAAHGLPVVATQHAGIPTQVIHGTTGLLCAEHDVDATVKALVRLAEEADLRKAMGRAARRHVRERFDRTMQLDALARYVSSCSSR